MLHNTGKVLNILVCLLLFFTTILIVIKSLKLQFISVDKCFAQNSISWLCHGKFMKLAGREQIILCDPWNVKCFYDAWQSVFSDYERNKIPSLYPFFFFFNLFAFIWLVKSRDFSVSLLSCKMLYRLTGTRHSWADHLRHRNRWQTGSGLCSASQFWVCVPCSKPISVQMCSPSKYPSNFPLILSFIILGRIPLDKSTFSFFDFHEKNEKILEIAMIEWKWFSKFVELIFSFSSAYVRTFYF